MPLFSERCATPSRPHARTFLFADRQQIKALLGGNLVFISSGAAPLSPEVHEMLKIAFCCEVVQGVSLPCSITLLSHGRGPLTVQCGMTETIGTTSRG